MRPLRLLLSLTSCIVAITLLLYVSIPAARNPSTTSPPTKQGRLSAFFSFHTPSSLFPPSAIISLTDDNSTFFLARPAAFGPYLPSKGLSGQLWIGSGFGDDHLGHGGLATGAEGELGCSDVPGWDVGMRKPTGKENHDGTTRRKSLAAAGPNAGVTSPQIPSRFKREDEASASKNSEEAEPVPAPVEDDGTDEILQDTKVPTDPISVPPKVAPYGSQAEHADIQSLQESAEIAGKVVLLSRGGCSFLDKVKWVQRRGGVALIVGDDVRGGPLKTMYARGDTSNITLPALFTSHTTAHLLSSLIPSGGAIDPVAGIPAIKPGLPAKEDSKTDSSKGDAGNKPAGSRPTFTRTSAAPKPTKNADAVSLKTEANPGAATAQKPAGFFTSLSSFFGLGVDKPKSPGVDSKRPPSSGHIDWVLLEDWNDDKPPKPTSKPKEAGLSKKPKSTSSKPSDGFQIGVQDWRDPDLVQTEKPKQTENAKQSKPKDVSGRDNKHQNSRPKGGSITPGSGVYEKPSNDPVDLKPHAGKSPSAVHHDESAHVGEEKGWLSRFPWGGKSADHTSQPHTSGDHKTAGSSQKNPAAKTSTQSGSQANAPEIHEGLWVTLTPTSMSSSPFFDTLLVLVVSPLITLTVVYALLLLRSRIRRRRWRAPKSVVERLPVRTYHTLSNDTTQSATPVETPVIATPTTPLIATTSQSRINRPRPRSRTASEVPEQASSIRSTVAEPSSPESEKRDTGLAEWRRRYGGRQKECVVCLEEYVDGVSRVMSLPCGHEFHAECITPWLTTRRRTCPICKGDVVRSLASNASSSHPNNYHYIPFHDDSEDEDVQAQALENRNDSPASAMPIPVEELESEVHDVERGHESDSDNDSVIVGRTRVVDAADTPRALWRRMGDLASWPGGRRRGMGGADVDRNR